jgi:Asp-tRNA(Asn)/Glu-tRNA(Gln) amidotransferase A subunit family amidase
MGELHEMSIGQIVAGLMAGNFSPSEIANAYIARYQLMEKASLAWEVYDPEALKSQARALEKRLISGEVIRPFESVPFGIKDIFNTTDFPTQMGSPLWKGFTPGNDARTVFNARELGALIPGKTATAEFAVHALGKTMNPHSSHHTPGTSSSGSAAAVATRMVPAALGTQTAGSISRPASFCGVYGMKPSFGLLPRTGMLKTTDTLDSIGFFTVHQVDLRRVLNGLRVRGRNYPVVHARVDGYLPKNKDRPWRIAFIKTHTWSDADNCVKKTLLDWINRVSREADVELVEVEEPALLSEAHRVHSIIYDKALAYYFKQEFKRRELISPIMYEIIEHGNDITQEEYVAALSAQAEMAAAMDALLGDFDAFVSIGTASVAPLRTELERPDPSLMWTLTYLPTVAVPSFKSTEGLPFGFQLGASRYGDYRLLDFLDLLEKRGLVPSQSLAIENPG